MTRRLADFFKDAIKTAQETVAAEQGLARVDPGPPPPDSVEAFAALIDAALDAGDVRAARETLKQAFTVFPKSHVLNGRHGDVSQAEGDLAGAEAAYLETLQRDDKQAEVHLRLGILRQAMGRHEDAEPCFRKALALDRRALEARRYLAIGYMMREAWKEALAQVALIKLVDPLDVPATMLEATVLERLGDAAGALALLENLVFERKADAQVFWRIGRIHVAARRADQALAAFRRCVEREPDRWEAWFYIGRFTEAADPATALAAYEQVLAGQPAHGDAALRAGRLLVAARQHARALDRFTVAMGSEKHHEAAAAEHAKIVALLAAMAANLAGDAPPTGAPPLTGDAPLADAPPSPAAGPAPAA